MSDPRTIYLADYQPFPFLLPQVALEFQLAPQATRVRARLAFQPNPARPGRHDLFLHGENLRLIGAKVDGTAVQPALDDSGMTISAKDLPDGPFTLETEVEIAPEANTALEGLYMSKGLCCTNRVRDSSRESSVLGANHEQTDTPRLQDPQLAGL